MTAMTAAPVANPARPAAMVDETVHAATAVAQVQAQAKAVMAQAALVTVQVLALIAVQTAAATAWKTAAHACPTLRFMRNAMR